MNAIMPMEGPLATAVTNKHSELRVGYLCVLVVVRAGMCIVTHFGCWLIVLTSYIYSHHVINYQMTVRSNSTKT